MARHAPQPAPQTVTAARWADAQRLDQPAKQPE